MKDTYAEKAVRRFWLSLFNGINVLLEQKEITIETTIFQLLEKCKGEIDK